MRTFSMPQVDGFPPKSELVTAFVEHGIGEKEPECELTSQSKEMHESEDQYCSILASPPNRWTPLEYIFADETIQAMGVTSLGTCMLRVCQRLHARLHADACESMSQGKRRLCTQHMGVGISGLGELRPAESIHSAWHVRFVCISAPDFLLTCPDLTWFGRARAVVSLRLSPHMHG